MAGLFRAQSSFLVGLQGLIAAGILGGWHGKHVRGNTATDWRGGQRFWYWLNAGVAFTVITSAIPAMANARPGMNAWQWMSRLLRGLESEPFYGISVFNPTTPVGGGLSGGGWIFFTLLDSLLFLGMGLIFFGAAAEPGRTSPPAPETPTPLRHPARTWFLIQTPILLVFIITGLARANRMPPLRTPGDLSSQIAAREIYLQFEGLYRFDDGGGLLAPPGTPVNLALRLEGWDRLVGRDPDQPGQQLWLDPLEQGWRARLIRNERAHPLQAAFLEDGPVLEVSGQTARHGPVRIQSRPKEAFANETHRPTDADLLP